MRQLLKSLYKQVRVAHWAVTNELVDLERDDELQPKLTDQVDDLYALKESWKLVDALRKELGRAVEALETKVCFRYVAEGDGDPVRTDYCSATPRARQTVKLPSKGSPEWNLLMTYFGVPLDAPFSPDWNRMIERVTDDMAAGKPCPPGCDPSQMYVICGVTVRKKRSILDDGESVPEQDPHALRHVAEAVRLLRDVDVEKSQVTILRQAIECLQNAAELEELNQPPEGPTAKKVNEAVPAFMRPPEENPF